LQSWRTAFRRVHAAAPLKRRYAVAGDLPGQGDALDHALLGELVRANEGRRGFAFTHKPLATAEDQEAIRWSNANGFAVNLSADTLEQADERVEMCCGPVVVVLPEAAPARLMTPGGRHVVVCPAETHAALDCARCGLCAISKRKVIVGFRAHGQMKNTVSGIARGDLSTGYPENSYISPGNSQPSQLHESPAAAIPRARGVITR